MAYCNQLCIWLYYDFVIFYSVKIHCLYRLSLSTKCTVGSGFFFCKSGHLLDNCVRRITLVSKQPVMFTLVSKYACGFDVASACVINQRDSVMIQIHLYEVRSCHVKRTPRRAWQCGKALECDPFIISRCRPLMNLIFEQGLGDKRIINSVCPLCVQLQFCILYIISRIDNSNVKKSIETSNMFMN